MNSQSTMCRRYIFLNHGEDNNLSGNYLCRFFGSVDMDGNIIRSEDIDIDSDEGLIIHQNWRFLFYNAISAAECMFYQRAIGRLLEIDSQKSNSPTVFIHRGGQELKRAKMVTDWNQEYIKRQSLDPNLATRLKEMRALGIPMSRGDKSSFGWSYSFIVWYDSIVNRISAGQVFMKSDILFRDLEKISEGAQKFYSTYR